MKRSGLIMKLYRYFVLTILLISACSGNRKLTPEQIQEKIKVSETKQADLMNEIVGAKGCSKISIKVTPFGDIGVDVVGTFTNECEKKIKYAKIESACFDSSGNLVDVDSEYVENVLPGEDAYFKSPMNATPSQIDNCISEIVEAIY